MSSARKLAPPDAMVTPNAALAHATSPARRASARRKVDADALRTASPGRVAGGEIQPTELIVAAVTRAIVEHRLLPGAKLVEQKIGDRFGVSRTIVRQALFRLAELKLVQLEPARGAFVAAPSIQEARDVFAVRRMVETQMLRELVATARLVDIRRLKAHLKAEREAVARIDVPTRTKLLFDFHVRLAEVLGNQVLVALIAELVSRCSLITLMYQSSDDAERSNAEHRGILQAIESRDADAAVALMEAHLMTVEQQLTEHRRAPGLPCEAALRPAPS